MLRRAVVTACFLTVISHVPPLSAQDKSVPEAIIYRDPGFSGPAAAQSRATPDLGLAWPVRSLRINRGQWQLCSQPNFRGTCFTTGQSLSNIGNRLGAGSRLGSIRPISGDQGGGGPGGPGWGGGDLAPGTGRSLKGMAAQFYPDPTINRRRVLACVRGSATTACAAKAADEFCARSGWTASAREGMETVNRRVYLADVLCSRTGR
jgi:hypothetical protein